jgi:hypothetical protein
MASLNVDARFNEDGEQVKCAGCGSSLVGYEGSVFYDLTYIDCLGKDVDLITGCESCLRVAAMREEQA